MKRKYINMGPKCTKRWRIAIFWGVFFLTFVDVVNIRKNHDFLSKYCVNQQNSDNNPSPPLPPLFFISMYFPGQKLKLKKYVLAYCKIDDFHCVTKYKQRPPIFFFLLWYFRTTFFWYRHSFCHYGLPSSKFLCDLGPTWQPSYHP